MFEMKQSVNFCDLKCFISLMKHILVSTQTPLKYYVKVCKDVSDVAKHLANTLLLCCCIPKNFLSIFRTASSKMRSVDNICFCLSGWTICGGNDRLRNGSFLIFKYLLTEQKICILIFILYTILNRLLLERLHCLDSIVHL